MPVLYHIYPFKNHKKMLDIEKIYEGYDMIKNQKDCYTWRTWLLSIQKHQTWKASYWQWIDHRWHQSIRFMEGFSVISMKLKDPTAPVRAWASSPRCLGTWPANSVKLHPFASHAVLFHQRPAGSTVNCFRHDLPYDRLDSKYVIQWWVSQAIVRCSLALNIL